MHFKTKEEKLINKFKAKVSDAYQKAIPCFTKIRKTMWRKVNKIRRRTGIAVRYEVSIDTVTGEALYRPIG